MKDLSHGKAHCTHCSFTHLQLTFFYSLLSSPSHLQVPCCQNAGKWAVSLILRRLILTPESSTMLPPGVTRTLAPVCLLPPSKITNSLISGRWSSGRCHPGEKPPNFHRKPAGPSVDSVQTLATLM